MNAPLLTSAPGQEPVIVEGVFSTSAARLFRAWTTPDEIVKWFGAGETPLQTATIDVRTGGLWEFAYAERDGVQDVLKGEYVDIAPNARLIFTWTHERRAADGGSETTQPSLVTVTFEDVEGGARLRLLHERIATEGGRLGVRGGWAASFEMLLRYLSRTP